MAQGMYYGSINLSKIDQDKLFTGKTGDKYLNVTIWVNDTPDKFGNNASIQQSQSKEERDAKIPKIYLGNLKKNDGFGGKPKDNPIVTLDTPDDLPF